MSDRRRIVTIDSAGAVTTVKDLEDSTNYYAVKSSFKVTPAAATAIDAQRQRRFGGAIRAGETHDNASVGWQMVARAATYNTALDNIESAFAQLKTTRQDLFLEWRPDGATNSTYYEIRGTATLTPTYDWATFQQTRSLLVDIEIPVAPLARGDISSITIASTTLPGVVQLSSAIPGSAPALADITLRKPSGTAVFALIGWAKRPGTPLASTVAPFGFIEAETGTGLSGWASTADATYRGGTGLKVTTAGAGTASATFAVDPSVLELDDFAVDDVDVEVWGRVQLTSTVVSPTFTLSLDAGLSLVPQYSAEYGSPGKLLTLPSSGSAFRFTKLGSLSMPVNKATPIAWNLKVGAAWGAGSSGVLGLDYLTLVPSRARALSPTGKPLDNTYPRYLNGTADLRKTIRGNDLSGLVATGTGTFARDSGLGGSLVELPPGNVDLVLKLSDLAPDDPTSNTSSETLSLTTVTGTVVVTPRYYLVRGT